MPQYNNVPKSPIFSCSAQNLVDDAIDAAANDQIVEDIVEGDVVVGHLRPHLEARKLLAAAELGGELAHVKTIRTFGIVAGIGAGGGVVIGDED